MGDSQRWHTQHDLDIILIIVIIITMIIFSIIVFMFIIIMVMRHIFCSISIKL